MKLTVALNDNLLDEAAEITGINEKETLINEALSELVKLHQRRGMLSFENSDIWENSEYILQRVN
jgi:Arc/MetJ family transcription regulator